MLRYIFTDLDAEDWKFFTFQYNIVKVD
ncbi:TPA: hypothetical protein ACOB5I_002234 [Neisseria gonorrhoeae]